MSKEQFRKLLRVLAVLALLTGCKRPGDAPRVPAGYFHTPFQDESQFIVETIVSDLAEQMFYASHHRLPDPKHFSVRAVEKPNSAVGAPVYDLRIALEPGQPDLQIELDVNGPIWSPETYTDATAALAKRVKLEPASPPPPQDTALLKSLLEGSGARIELQNQNLSQDLEKDFTNSALHEKAAVLLGAFALREHSGHFFEIRSPLCRMTAHLAMAQFLGGGQPPGINGQVAEAMLLLLMNNQAPALEKLKGIAPTDETLKEWAGALRARATSDYRPLAAAKNLSPVERVAWFQALATSVSADIAWSKLSEAEKREPDFARIAYEENSSVGTGNELLGMTLASEMREIGSVYELAWDKQIEQSNIVARLNEMPGRCFATNGTSPKVLIIGWGQWAMFFQRQLGHAIEHDFDVLERKQGLPEDAKEFDGKCEQAFGKLRLYPFVRRFNATDSAGYHAAVDDAFKVTVETPQLTPADCWNYLCYYGPNKELYQPNPNPHINEWHKHNPPQGTAYDPLPRFNQPSLINRPDSIALVENLYALAPYDMQISYNLLRMKYKTDGKSPTYEHSREVYQPVLPYAVWAMMVVAETVEKEPDRYEALAAQAAALDPARYFNLGTYFQNLKEDDKAANYFEMGNALCDDSVSASYHASWLERYYLNKGETNKARVVADAAGETYSARGLQAKAEFLEATGKYTEAFEWYLKNEERYDQSEPLIRFCRRYKAKTGSTRFDGELKSRVMKQFPDGQEKVSLGSFHEAPADGTLIKSESDLARSAGLRMGDVIVALNGIRVHSQAQYNAVRDGLATPEMTLIVWQGNQYKEIHASPPEHLFKVTTGDFPPKAPGKR